MVLLSLNNWKYYLDISRIQVLKSQKGKGFKTEFWLKFTGIPWAEYI